MTPLELDETSNDVPNDFKDNSKLKIDNDKGTLEIQEAGFSLTNKVLRSNIRQAIQTKHISSLKSLDLYPTNELDDDNTHTTTPHILDSKDQKGILGSSLLNTPTRKYEEFGGRQLIMHIEASNAMLQVSS